MEKFRKLGIIEPILKSIQEQDFKVPSEIQEKAIPLILEGKDVIAGASTGSGKTLVFASSIIKECENGNGLQALILAPTRELAEQVSETIRLFSKNKKLNILSVYGGVSILPQITYLRRADVVVGTPGRILDHLSRGTIRLDRVKILVLDEADRMLDMGFQRDVERIIYSCPKERQTLLFSATISREVSRLAQRYMKNPVEVSAEAYVDPSKLKQVYYDVDDNQKFSLLVHLLKNEKSGLAMVFCNTQRNTDFVSDNLTESGVRNLAIHGGHTQGRRTQTMKEFSSTNETSVLVCTDVASRGLDIKGVSHIYNYDLPKDNKEYIHRIGRTARAGAEGKVINILATRDYDNFDRIMKSREFNITKEEVPEIERVYIKTKRNNGNFGQRGHFRRGNGGHSNYRGRSRRF
jgi:ATP-dependent RNA helicase DeaD